MRVTASNDQEGAMQPEMLSLQHLLALTRGGPVPGFPYGQYPRSASRVPDPALRLQALHAALLPVNVADDHHEKVW